MNEDIRIYVADLSAYNNGKLHGVWINAMLKGSPEEDAEEYAIHDYEGFDGYGLSEYEGIQSVHEVACFIDENPKLGDELLNNFGGDLEDARKAVDENYNGCYSSLADYAEELTEGTTEIPQHLAFYIDYEKMGREMELSGDIYTITTTHDEVHIFWNH